MGMRNLFFICEVPPELSEMIFLEPESVQKENPQITPRYDQTHMSFGYGPCCVCFSPLKSQVKGIRARIQTLSGGALNLPNLQTNDCLTSTRKFAQLE